MFTVTKQWIHANTTKAGSWNARQLRCLGIDWPARKGWIKDVEGMPLTDCTKALFESCAHNKVINIKRYASDFDPWTLVIELCKYSILYEENKKLKKKLASMSNQ